MIFIFCKDVRKTSRRITIRFYWRIDQITWSPYVTLRNQSKPTHEILNLALKILPDLIINRQHPLQITGNHPINPPNYTRIQHPHPNTQDFKPPKHRHQHAMRIIFGLANHIITYWGLDLWSLLSDQYMDDIKWVVLVFGLNFIQTERRIECRIIWNWPEDIKDDWNAPVTVVEEHWEFTWGD